MNDTEDEKGLSKAQSKYPNLTITNTKGPKPNPLGARLCKALCQVYWAALKNSTHCGHVPEEEFWSPNFLTQILMVAFSLYILLSLEILSTALFPR